MVFLMAAFCAGVIILYSSGQLLPWFYYIFVIAVIILVRPTRLTLAILCGLAGAGYANFEALSQLDEQLAEHWEQQELFVTGYACSLPVHRSYYSQIDFCAYSAEPAGGSLSVWSEGVRRLKLTWSGREIDWYHPVHRLKVSLKRPRSAANPLGFSYEKHLFYSGISASGSIKNSELVHADLAIPRAFESGLTRLRMGLSDRLSSLVSELEYGGIMHALILGDKSKIEFAHTQLLRQTGTQHLLAISGLHVGMVMFLLFRLLPRCRLALAVVCVCGLSFILLVGFGPSAQRAWVMCSLAMFVIYGTNVRRSGLFFFGAMSFVLLLDPLSSLNLGFWYSFYAVALLLALGALKMISKRAGALIIVQGCLMLGLVLLNTWYVMPQGWSQGLANTVAIPWVAGVVLPGCLLSFAMSFLSPELALVGLKGVDTVLSFLFPFLDSIPSSGEIKPIMKLEEWMAFALVFIALLLFARLFVFSVCLLLSLMAYSFVPKDVSHPSSELWVMDVGQGLSIFLQHEGSTWVYDLGPAYERFSSFESVLRPFVLANGYQVPVDGMVLSHGDNDHAGDAHGAVALLRPIELWSGEPNRVALVEARMCQQGMSWRQGGLSLDVLYPLEGFKPESSNNRSCVIKISMAGVVFLLMGDLEGKAEMALIEAYGGRLKADVLIAGHHGSKNATTTTLLKHVQPEWVVFSAGYLNRFGHPHDSVRERAISFGAQDLNTADQGALHFSIDNGEVNVSFVRDHSRPFWMSGPGRLR